jgi:DNA-directed RNA polymerase subunit RPC12/RpoP
MDIMKTIKEYIRQFKEGKRYVIKELRIPETKCPTCGYKVADAQSVHNKAVRFHCNNCNTEFANEYSETWRTTKGIVVLYCSKTHFLDNRTPVDKKTDSYFTQ